MQRNFKRKTLLKSNRLLGDAPYFSDLLTTFFFFFFSFFMPISRKKNLELKKTELTWPVVLPGRWMEEEHSSPSSSRLDLPLNL